MTAKEVREWFDTQDAEEVWSKITSDPKKAQLARSLFLLLCDRPEAKSSVDSEEFKKLAKSLHRQMPIGRPDYRTDSQFYVRRQSLSLSHSACSVNIFLAPSIHRSLVTTRCDMYNSWKVPTK